MMSAAMPMQSGMMGMMPMNMMGNMMPMSGMNMNMPMSGMNMMPMGGGQMMNQMPMMMPMPMMVPMMCRMTCEMQKDGMVCKLMPMDASQMDMMRERCNAMTAMMAMGMPMMMMCGGMPIMMAMSGMTGAH
jgi:hypothetical protein